MEGRPGIADQAVDASQGFVNGGKQPRHVILERDVGLDRDRTSPGRLCGVDNLTGRHVIPQVVDGDVVSVPGEVEGGRRPDPPARPGHDGDRPGQLVHGGIIADQQMTTRKGAPVARRPLVRRSEGRQAVAIQWMNFELTVPMPVMPSKPGAVFTVTSRDAQLPVPSQ